MFYLTGLEMTCYLSSAVFQSSSSLRTIQICSQQKSTKVSPSNNGSNFQWWSSEMRFSAWPNLSLLCRKCLWLGNPFDLWSLTEMRQTMQSTSCFFLISLSSEFCIEGTCLPLEDLVTCFVCCPSRYICNKCVPSLCDNSWLQFIPLSWGICQTSESLADSVPWMMNNSGCPCPVQRQRCWHTRLFSEKSGFL